ncbi:MAG: hypothetical protein K2X57_16560, partial [Xanthobacteraceae bacterium]|nr:hypothetical protein [Xanthobacteraceae bacterium]
PQQKKQIKPAQATPSLREFFGGFGSTPAPAPRQITPPAAAPRAPTAPGAPGAPRPPANVGRSAAVPDGSITR